jgi:oligopeptide transport system permease protein
MNQYNNIPVEKFKFAQREDLSHDKKFDTKPVTYLQGAFRRFCKNKGAVVAAVVISILLLFAIIAPFCTPYTPAYYDPRFSAARPKNKLFEETNFWDGCREKEVGYLQYFKDYALGLEIGEDVIKNNKVEITETADGSKLYKYRFDTYHGSGFGMYMPITPEEFEDIQRYQNETGRQVLYPIVKLSDRPTTKEAESDANIYYKTKVEKGKSVPDLDKDGNLQLNYWLRTEKVEEGGIVAKYTSLRIEGEDGIVGADGNTYYYAYGRKLEGGNIEVRLENFEYYTYEHTQKYKDGIEEPYFLFGTTDVEGKDIFSCLANGARFSFVFALVVAIVNLVVGAIWGSISGYFGGKLDLFMERFCEILGSVPTMIVITLLKYHMGSSSHVIVLFIAFFATGWIGMAGSTRMQFYRFKNQEYVLAARTLGAGDARIMFKHIFPNGIGTLVTRCALVIPSMIYSEANLSYLGIINLEAGSVTSVGTMIATGQTQYLQAPYVAMFPCAFLVLLMLSFNLFGNGLRDAFNPSLRGSEG